MLRFLGILSLSLGLGIFQAPAQPDPAEMVAKAVAKAETEAKSKGCKHELKKVEFDEDGNEMPTSPDKDDKRVVRDVSLKFLFRHGRFKYESKPDEYYRGVLTQKIGFSPRPEKHQLKPLEGEDKYFNLGVNNLTGDVWIEKSTGSLIGLDAGILSKVPIKVGFIRVGHIHLFKAVFEQKQMGKMWLPESAKVTAQYGHILERFVHDEYTASFDCK